MNHLIFCFSGTGNSLAIAKELAAGLAGAELLSVADLAQDRIPVDKLIKASTIGIVFPVYMWGMPLMVAESLKKIPAECRAYLYSVTNCGGSSGRTLLKMNGDLKSRGLKLSAGWVLLMPGNYTPMYGAIDTGKQQKLFGKMKARIPEILQAIQEKKSSRIEHSFFLIDWIFSGIIYRLGSSRIPQMDSKYWIIEERCNRCGICARVCPVGNIVMDGGRPQWNHHCQQCVACLQWCPQQAIQYGKNTLSRKRYHHPDIQRDDIIQLASNS